MITNDPKAYVKDYRTDNLRAAEENRAKWFLYLYKEGKDSGLSSEFAAEAMRESGKFMAKDVFKGVNTPETFGDTIMDEVHVKAYEGTAVSEDGQTKLCFAYCPMVNAWSKLVPESELPELCAICEEMYKACCE